jgi:predicted amidohydrolase YtcJ
MSALKIRLAIILFVSFLLSNCAPANQTTSELQTETSTATQQVILPSATPGIKADIIFRNGTILTMDPDQPSVNGIAIRGNEIIAVGENYEMSAYVGDDTQVINLRGHTIMPGFVDSHNHVYFHAFNDGTDLTEIEDWLLSMGITTTAEMTVEPDQFEWMLDAYTDGTLRLRHAIYLEYTNACGDVAGQWYLDHPSAHLMDDTFRVPGIKIFTDGGACNRPAVSFETETGGHGDLYFDDATLTQVVVDAQISGYQVAIHALGDRGAELALNAIETALNGQPNTYRHRIEHNTLLRDDLLPRYGEIGVVPLIFGKFPTCFFTGETNQFKYLTPTEYISWEWRYGDLISTNPDLTYAWHSDYPVFSSINPFEHLYGFVTRKEVGPDGQICLPPDWALDDVIPVEQALTYMTINSAYATFYDDIVGSLQVGKFADLVILSNNPLDVDPDELINISVKMTMVDGRVEYCAEGQESLCPE